MTTSTGPELSGDFGMVATTHWHATAVAMSVLERGGNAFDAAVAAGFALQAVQPHQNGPGGEVPAVFWSASEGRIRVLNGQGVSPAAATIEAFTSLGLDSVPGTGLLAATVPGVFGGWMLLLEQYGTWSLRDVLEPAIGLLRRGFVAGAHLTGELAGVSQHFEEAWPTSQRQWSAARLASGRGDVVTNAVLASTYERVLSTAEASSGTRDGQIRAARASWYSGFVAEAIGAFSLGSEWSDTTGEPHAGLLTASDLDEWSPTFEDPLTVDYGRYTVAKTNTWGQGPVVLQQLALLRGLGLDGMPYLSADYVHTVVEAGKLAFADREAWYGDTLQSSGVTAALLSEEYAAERRGLIDGTANGDLRPGSPLGRSPRLARSTDRSSSDAVAVGASGPATGIGDPTRHLPNAGPVYGDTCHLDIVDRWGNMVSATPSGGWLQSSPTIPSLGFCLGTRGQMFWLEEGLTTSLVPRTRPRTTLSPGLALRDGRPWMAFGTPGGDMQDQWSLNFFLTKVHTGLDLRDSLDQPTFHSENFPLSFYPRTRYPNRLTVEADFPSAVVEELRRRGHEVVLAPAGTLGKTTAVTTEDGVLRGAADLRASEPYAAGR